MADWLDKYEKARLEQRKVFTLDVIPTAYSELDDAIGVKGIPRGKITEIAGHSSVGKTALVLDILAQAQARGLNVVYMDLDRKFDKQFALYRAIKLDELLIFRPDPQQAQNTVDALKKMIEQNLIELLGFKIFFVI